MPMHNTYTQDPIPDIWYLISDTRYLMPDTWYLTPNTWHLTPDAWCQRTKRERASSCPANAGRLSYVFVVGTLLFNICPPEFARVYQNFYRISLEFHPKFTGTSNWNTSTQKRMAMTQPFPHPPERRSPGFRLSGARIIVIIIIIIIRNTNNNT